MRLNQLTYGFVGLGLMGGSLAKAIRKYVLSETEPRGKIYALDKNLSSIEDAILEKTIDEGFSESETEKMLSLCDVVFVCLYPKATGEFLAKYQDCFKSGSIVTDIAGVKSQLIENLSWKRSDVVFVPGHPMAGNEREGFTHSSGEIFQNRNYIFMEGIVAGEGHDEKSAKAFETLKEIATKIGFSRIIKTDAKVHDHKIAFTSQLCHVIASALVDSAEDTNVTAFGGGSFEDLTRIAMINAPLWTELFIADKDELLGHISEFQSSLENLKNAIENEDTEKLNGYLSNVRARRVAMANPK
jgi:prephenate dehydrogenase